MAKKKSKKAPIGGIGVIYARFSSHNQRDISIDQQVDTGMKTAAEYNIRIVKIYADRAISGRSDKKMADFQNMLRDAEKGEFQFVVSWKSNRMGRNMLEAMINEAKLNAMGIRVIYTEENFDDTAAGRFAARSMMNVNQFYSESMAEDVMRGMNDNAENCLANGKASYGFKKAPDGKFVIDEPKARILLEVGERVLAHEPFVDIYNDLNARGIPSPSGGKWNRGSFHRMLTNERNRGVYIWGDVRVEGGMPRIMSDEMFYKIQEVLTTKKNSQGRHRAMGDYLLTGKLFCGHCNAPMTGCSGTSKTKALHHYYVCQTRRVEHTCKKENVRRDEIEIAVAQAIKDYALQPDVIEWIADSTVAYAKKLAEGEHITVLQDRLDSTQKTIKNVMTAIEQGIFTDTTRERLLELEKEQAELTAKIKIEKSNIITVSRNDVIAGLSMFRDGNVHDKKYIAKLFDTFLVAVYLYDNELKIVFSFKGKKNTVNLPFDMSKLGKGEKDGAKKCSFKLPDGSPRRRKRHIVCGDFSMKSHRRTHSVAAPFSQKAVAMLWLLACKRAPHASACFGLFASMRLRRNGIYIVLFFSVFCIMKRSRSPILPQHLSYSQITVLLFTLTYTLPAFAATPVFSAFCCKHRKSALLSLGISISSIFYNF